MQQLAGAHQPRQRVLDAHGDPCERGEGGTQPLATGIDEVAGDRGDLGDVADDEFAQDVLGGGQIGSDQRQSVSRTVHSGEGRTRRESCGYMSFGGTGDGGHELPPWGFLYTPLNFFNCF